MRIQTVALRAASAATIGVMALTMALISAPAQASRSAAGATVITVSANATVTGIDASLHHHGDGE